MSKRIVYHAHLPRRRRREEKSNPKTQRSLRFAEKRVRRRGILGFRTSPWNDGSAAESRGEFAANPLRLDAQKSGVKLLVVE
jgi:hypothetical protein